MGSGLREIAERLAPPHTLRRSAGRVALSTLRGFGSPMAGRASAIAATPADIRLPITATPTASVIIPVHDKWDMTVECLRSIARDRYDVEVEVIVVDDASSDETIKRLPSVDGAVVVRLEDNVGFLGAVNAGIQRARGRYLVLLNNDTIVSAGWLNALVATAMSDPSVGVVGAKLVYPDGSLQEAGGIIWRDATGFNFGRGERPDDPRFSFVREVDYCSGACILVTESVIAAAGGGFDPRFAPAYYEDTDLCFTARANGFRVIYQPAAVVEHREGASHGTDVAHGVKRYQEVNRETFAQKWADALLEQDAYHPVFVRKSSWRTSAGRCLVMDHAVPMPDHDSGSRRMSELLNVLQRLGFGVTFVPQWDPNPSTYRDALTARGIEVLRGPDDVDEYLNGVAPDLRFVVLSRPTIAWANYPRVRLLAPQSPVIYDTVDLHYARERGLAATHGDATAARRAEHYFGIETALMRLVDQVWTVSEEEAREVQEVAGSVDVCVVPNIHALEPAGPPYESREGILFVGGYAHAPNRDAVRWFVAEILPLVRKRLPDVPVSLVGSNVTPDVAELAGDGVTIHGWVPDLSGIYASSRLFVAPLRFGAGMKGKVGEACAFGLPMVTTSIGAEGMGFENGKDALVRDDVTEFADAVTAAYSDRELWGTLARNGQDLVRRRYSPDAVGDRVADALGRLGVRVRAG